MEFQPFPKIARLNRECTITEKIDGSNSQVFIAPVDWSHPDGVRQPDGAAVAAGYTAIIDDLAIYAGSRSRWIQPGKTTDNFGFAAWVKDNAAELVKLGPGGHFGEWWGSGIQRGYGLGKGEKRFSLFNVARWDDPAVRPSCCAVVPTLYVGQFNTAAIDSSVEHLRGYGSHAAPGFLKPEGIIVWHDAARQFFKVTLEKDSEPKGVAVAA